MEEYLDTCPECGHEPPVLSIVFSEVCELCGCSLVKKLDKTEQVELHENSDAKK